MSGVLSRAKDRLAERPAHIRPPLVHEDVALGLDPPHLLLGQPPLLACVVDSSHLWRGRKSGQEGRVPGGQLVALVVVLL